MVKQLSDEEAWRRAQAMHPDFQNTLSDEEAQQRLATYDIETHDCVRVVRRRDGTAAVQFTTRVTAPNLQRLAEHFKKPRK